MQGESNYGGNSRKVVPVEGFRVTRGRKQRYYGQVMILGLLVAAPATMFSQAAPGEAYKPKFAGDPARSESESNALAYMRTLLRAEHTYKQRHGTYAETLSALAGTGSFTKRLASSTERGDYTASFKPHKEKKNKDEEGFVLTMTPKQMDAEHRSFYAEEDGVIHADDQKAADADSPKVK